MSSYPYQQLIPQDFAADSRVWIFQSSRLFSLSEALAVEEILKGFVGQWTSHGAPVKGFADLWFGQFVILMADESTIQVGGCSTDSSVRVIKEIESRFQVSLFDRQTLAFVIKEKVELLPLSQLPYAAENGFIGPDTLYFNNLVQTRADLEKNWLQPVKSSWLAKRLFKDKTAC